MTGPTLAPEPAPGTCTAPTLGRVVAVAADDSHRFSKPVRERIELVAGIGVRGDAHAGATVAHRFDARRDPQRPNLRQVHLLGEELLHELGERGFGVAPGDVGENITTAGLDLLGFPTGTRLRLGPDAVVELTGLRTPCAQLDRFQGGLMGAMLDRDAAGELIRRAGVMATVVASGEVTAGDAIGVTLPDGDRRPLGPV